MASPDYGGCPVEAGPLVEKEIDRVRTQYRESDKLLAVLRADLEQIAEVMQVVCAIPDAFDLEGVGIASCPVSRYTERC